MIKELILCIGLLFGVAHTSLNDNENPNAEINLVQESINDQMDNVQMKTDKRIYSKDITSINLEINNYEQKYRLAYGAVYELEKLENGVWKQVPFKSRVGFEEWCMTTQDQYIAGVNLNKLEASLDTGSYKITKEVFVYPVGGEGNHASGKNFVLEAQFNIK